MSLTVSAARIVEESDSPLLAAPEGWPRKRLGDVATILNGYAFKSKQFVSDGGMPLIRIRDIRKTSTAVGFVGDYDERYVVHEGELLVGMDGDFNCARWAGPDALLNQRVCKITPNSELLDLDYLTAALPGYLQAIHDSTSSTTVTHLSSRDLADIPLPLPPITEQQTFATLTGRASTTARSATSHLRSARLAIDRFRQAVLAAACSGRLTAGWRETSTVCDTAEDLIARSRAAVAKFPVRRSQDPWSPPDWLDIPVSWAWAPVRDLAMVRGGIQKQPKRTPKSNRYPYLRVANVLRGRLNLEDVHEFELFNDELSTYRLEPGDLLVVEGNGSAAEIGRAAIWHGEVADCVHQNHIIRVRPVEMIPDFLELFWNSPIGAREVASLAVTSAGLYSLSTKKIGAVPVPVPPLDEQREVVRQAEALLAVADSVAARVADAQQRVGRSSQAVLAKAFRGDLVATSSEE